MAAEQPTSNPAPAPAPASSVPGRCFVCLTDEEPSDDWVKPCPCTVEGHQACVLEFINELDRERKPYQCPVCKTKLNVQQPLGALVPIHDTIYKTFARLSPALLGLGSLGGTLVGLSAYGVLAFRAFAGPEAAKRFLKQEGWDWHFLLLPTVAPVMVLSQSLPEISRRIINPIAFAVCTSLVPYATTLLTTQTVQHRSLPLRRRILLGGAVPACRALRHPIHSTNLPGTLGCLHPPP